MIHKDPPKLQCPLRLSWEKWGERRRCFERHFYPGVLDLTTNVSRMEKKYGDVGDQGYYPGYCLGVPSKIFFGSSCNSLDQNAPESCQDRDAIKESIVSYISTRS